jgi:mannosyltransferase
VRRRELQLLGGIVALGALLRFATLDQQSFWYDESVTVGLVRMDFGDMLDRIPESESTPPLYYMVAWLWAKVFGTGEVGLRSLSALCGTAFVPVMYAIGARAVGIRVGLVAAGLAAVNPLLVWYSQEARTYALLVLLAGLSFLFFIRLLTGDPRRRTLVLWAVVSALALATHYFAAFLVAIEAVWLLASAANRRPIAVAASAVAVVELALLPLLLHQRSLELADFIDDTSLGYRLVRAPKQFLVGFDAPGEVITGVAAGLLVVLALWFVWSRGDDRERRAARIGLIVGGILLGATALLAIGGVDYFDTRNVLVAWPPLALAVAAGLGAHGAGRAGIATAAALALLCASTVLFVVTSESLQRDDWRGVAAALAADSPATPRAVVVTPSSAPKPFAVYAPRLELLPPDGAAVREVDVVALPQRHRTQSRPDDPPRPANPQPPPGFALAEKRYEDTFTLIRYAAPAPVTLKPEALAAAGLDPDRPAAIFFDR